jgi:hypothetical protein
MEGVDISAAAGAAEKLVLAFYNLVCLCNAKKDLALKIKISFI